MSTYLGFYKPTPDYLQENGARARAGDASPNPKFRKLVIDLPGALPSGCSIAGSYGTFSTELPSVMIVETNNIEDLFFIGQYYAGYLQFQWTPARVVGSTAQQREAAMNRIAAPAGVR